jgi:heterodisulfide reductase subunit C
LSLQQATAFLEAQSFPEGMLCASATLVFISIDEARRYALTAPEVINLTEIRRDATFPDRVTPGRKELRTCIQCGTCTASCPAAPAMDITPRQMWRMVNLGLEDEVLHSKTMWLCSICYQCTVRCPRGIPLTEGIAKLKQMAIQKQVEKYRESTQFYHAFSDVMRIYGRMREVEFMARYFLMTNPFTALGFTNMAITMLMRGKLKPELPKLSGEGRLDKLFKRVAELEGQQ